MKVINLLGSPGTGKSTTAAGLFHIMKLEGYNVELVTEYAKDIVWAENFKMLERQIMIFAEQNHRLDRLRNQVDYAITDSPLLLSHVYTPEGYYPSFKKLVDEVFDSYNNLNIMLERAKPYVDVGRGQTEAESDVMIEEIINCLCDREVITLPADKDAPKTILDILDMIK